jgi:NAD(P)-dependent dehydrogenase (short-subunit alcohol dehydrogenase family)
MVAETLENLSLDELEKSMSINALAPLVIIKKLLPSMKENNFGRIINLTSGAPLNCFPGYGAYSASKALLNSLTVTLAREMEEFNIKINLMSPGPVKTEMAPDAPKDVSVCFPTVEYLLNLKSDAQTGKFFWLGYEVPLFPDLEGVQWLEGIGNEKLRKIL